MRKDSRAKRARGAVQPLFVPGANRDPAAFSEQALRNRIAKSVAATDDGGNPALETEIQRLADGSFGDRRDLGGRDTAADQGLLGLGIEEVQVVCVDGDL